MATSSSAASYSCVCGHSTRDRSSFQQHLDSCTADSPRNEIDFDNVAAYPWPAPLVELPSGLAIRPYHPSDAAPAAEQANSARIAQQMSERFPHPYTEEAAREYVAKAMRPAQSGVFSWAITVDGAFVGSIGLQPAAEWMSHSADLGYWTGEQHWGKGYATAAVRALVDWAFAQPAGLAVAPWAWPLQRIGGTANAGNAASQAVMAKAGLRKEGVLRAFGWKQGRVDDQVVFGLSRAEWAQGRGGGGKGDEK